MSKDILLEKLTDQSYRDAFVSDEIDIGLPMQIRAMREARGWKQKDVAAQTGTKQSRFSLMEKPGYGKFALNTLKKLASIFDVGLIVAFVPYGEMIDFVEAMSNHRLAILSFAQEYPKLAKRYMRNNVSSYVNSTQPTLNFSGETKGAYGIAPSTATRTVGNIPISTSAALIEKIDAIQEYLIKPQGEVSTYVRH